MAPRLARLKLFVDLVVLSGGQLLSKLLGFLAFAYLARALGPEAYGSAEYVIGLATFFGMLIEFGLGPVAVRDLAREKHKLPSLTANIPFARLAIALLSAPVMVLAVRLSNAAGATGALAWLFACSLLLNPWKLEWLFQAREMMASAAGGQVIRMLVFATGVVLLVRDAGDLVRIGYVELAAAVVNTGYYLVIQHFWITPLNFRFSAGEAWALVREGASVGGSQMVSAFNLFAPLFLVATFASAEEIGWFGACHRVVASLSTFSLVYHFNLYPVLTRRIAGPPGALDAVLRASSRVVAWVSIGGALALTTGAAVALRVAFGEAFVQAAPAFMLLVWFLPVTMLSGHARWLLIAGKQQHYVLHAQLYGAAVTALVGVPAVHFFHAEGGACAMLAGALTVWAASHHYAAKHVAPLPGASFAAVPLLIALLCGAAAVASGQSPWLTTPAVLLAYVVLAPLVDRRLYGELRTLAAAKSDVTVSK